MEVGPHGALQTVADGVAPREEDLVPKDTDRFLFGLAPILAFAATMVGFAVVPFGPDLLIATSTSASSISPPSAPRGDRHRHCRVVIEQQVVAPRGRRAATRW
jgi:hypothetical protein